MKEEIQGMEIKVKYFGSISEETGKVEETVFLKDGAVGIQDFKAFIFRKYGLNEDDAIQVALNQAIQHNGQVQHGDEIAFLPPYAGG